MNKSIKALEAKLLETKKWQELVRISTPKVVEVLSRKTLVKKRCQEATAKSSLTQMKKMEWMEMKMLTKTVMLTRMFTTFERK